MGPPRGSVPRGAASLLAGKGDRGAAPACRGPSASLPPPQCPPCTQSRQPAGRCDPRPQGSREVPPGGGGALSPGLSGRCGPSAVLVTITCNLLLKITQVQLRRITGPEEPLSQQAWRGRGHPRPPPAPTPGPPDSRAPAAQWPCALPAWGGGCTCPRPCTVGLRVCGSCACTSVCCVRASVCPHTAGPTSARVGGAWRVLAPPRPTTRAPPATAWGSVFVWAPWEWRVALGTSLLPPHSRPLRSRLPAAGLCDEAGGVLAREPGCPSLWSQPSCSHRGVPRAWAVGTIARSVAIPPLLCQAVGCPTSAWEGAHVPMPHLT